MGVVCGRFLIEDQRYERGKKAKHFSYKLFFDNVDHIELCTYGCFIAYVQTDSKRSSLSAMTLLGSLGIVTIFWAVLFLLDRLLRRLRGSSYTRSLEKLGVTLSFAHVRCYTTKFNRLFYVLGSRSKSLCKCWFDVGALIGVSLMLLSVAVLIFTLYQALMAPDSSQQVLTPVMPGVNLPWSDVLYYFVTLIVCSIFHEAGHALAASAEQVKVNGFGVFMLFLYPGAFVDLHSDQLTIISPRKQLKIYCAGVWHNVILVLCALGLLWSLPFLLAPFYSTGLGAVVTYVDHSSVLAGKMEPGTVVQRLNGCAISSTKDWFSCLEHALLSSQNGYCLAGELLSNKPSFHENQTFLAEDGTRECCERTSLTDICFHVFSQLRQSTYKCLTARVVTARKTCTSSRDCLEPVEHHCVFPAISPPSKLIRITHTGGKDVLFLGDPVELHYIVSTSTYMPKSVNIPLTLPNLLQTMCAYFVSLSSALALLNMVPAYFLDGQWTLTVLVDLLLERRVPDVGKRTVICNCVLASGSLLLVLNLGLAIWTLINW